MLNNKCELVLFKNINTYISLYCSSSCWNKPSGARACLPAFLLGSWAELGLAQCERWSARGAEERGGLPVRRDVVQPLRVQQRSERHVYKAARRLSAPLTAVRGGGHTAATCQIPEWGPSRVEAPQHHLPQVTQLSKASGLKRYHSLQFTRHIWRK